MSIKYIILKPSVPGLGYVLRACYLKQKALCTVGRYIHNIVLFKQQFCSYLCPGAREGCCCCLLKSKEEEKTIDSKNAAAGACCKRNPREYTPAHWGGGLSHSLLYNPYKNIASGKPKNISIQNAKIQVKK